MGGAASISQDEVKQLPQYTIAGGDEKWSEIKGEDGNLSLPYAEDPYLKYGGRYSDSDPKNTPDFKYLEFDALPTFSENHKSAMSRHLTQEVFDKLKDVKSSKGYSLSNAIMTGVLPLI